MKTFFVYFRYSKNTILNALCFIEISDDFIRKSSVHDPKWVSKHNDSATLYLPLIKNSRFHFQFTGARALHSEENYLSRLLITSYTRARTKNSLQASWKKKERKWKKKAQAKKSFCARIPRKTFTRKFIPQSGQPAGFLLQRKFDGRKTKKKGDGEAGKVQEEKGILKGAGGLTPLSAPSPPALVNISRGAIRIVWCFSGTESLPFSTLRGFDEKGRNPELASFWLYYSGSAVAAAAVAQACVPTLVHADFAKLLRYFGERAYGHC